MTTINGNLPNFRELIKHSNNYKTLYKPCGIPAPDPTRAGASPLDPKEGSGNAADNSPLGSNSRRRFGRPSSCGGQTWPCRIVSRHGFHL